MRIRIVNAFCLAPILGVTLAAVSFAGPPNGSSVAPLVDAVKNRDQDAVKAMLKQRVDVNAAEADGTTALHWAAHWNDLETVDLLLKAGANAKATNRYGASPLSEAVANGSGAPGSGALIERLLKSGADPDTLSAPQGETVLMAAARVGNVEAVKILLDHGAYPDARETFRGQTALMWAASEGHPEVIKLLVAKGANINARSSDRDTTPPKMEAGTPAAPIARGGLSALHFAARQGQMAAAKALIEGGGDINQKDSDGNNALIVALLNSHYDFAQLLIDSKADPNVANKDGRTALYTAVEMHDADWSPLPVRRVEDKTSSLDIIRSLLAHGVNVNAQLTAPSPIVKMAQDTGDRTLGAGATAFMRAARSADAELMQILLDKGADAKLADKDGLNALMLAAGMSWADKIRGTEAQALEAVKLCAASGLDVNTATTKGDTAMHGAANRGADSIVKYLAEKGAKLDVKDKQGMTPLDLAMGKSPRTPAGGGSPRPAHESTVALLEQLLGPSASIANKSEQQDQ